MKTKFIYSIALSALAVAAAIGAPSTSQVISKPDGLHHCLKATDKQAFYDKTPAIVQPANTLNARQVLQALGLQAGGGTEPAQSLKAGTGTATYLPSGRLYSTGTPVATGANTTETDGISYTVPANTLSGNGQ